MAEPDELTAELDAIAGRIENGSRLRVAEQDAPRLLAAFRLLLGFHARCTTTEEYAAIVAALTGKEAPHG